MEEPCIAWKLYQVGSQYGSVYRGIDERGDIVTRQEQEDQDKWIYLILLEVCSERK